MGHQIKIALILFICLTTCFTGHAIAQGGTETPTADYIFETIEVPGVDFLEVTASNDFGDYAGNTRSPDGEKTIGFTLIDGVFTTYDFPGSLKTSFYAFDNAGKAAGHYKDTDGLYHGVIMQDGKLTQYDFPDAVETHIYGLSDETGALSGNIVDEAGVTHAFSGDLIITFPGAVATYGDFVNAAGAVVGSYVDADGMPHGFIRNPDGSFTTIDIPETPNLDFLFVNTITDFGVVAFRAKAVNDILRSYILLPDGVLYEVRIPGSVNTVVRNVNQDGSIIGFYDLTGGQRYGFVGRPATPSDKKYGNIFSMHLSQGLNMLSVPLKPTVHMTARSLAGKTGATTVITLDAANQKFLAWTPNAPDDGFPIEGAKGYIVNLPKGRDVVFTGTGWTHQREAAAAPSTTPPDQIWAFVVSGHLEGAQHFNGYTVRVRNLRTNTVMISQVRSNYFAAATVDLAYRSVVAIGDTIELIVTDTNGNIVSEKFNFTVNATNLEKTVLSVTLNSIGPPKQSRLLQNYPNPFNPETWIPYHLAEAGTVSLSIYDATGKHIRTLPIGYQSAGFYQSRGHAAYWDGRNALGEPVASGIYFYQLTTPSFQQTRRMLILK